MGHSIRAEVLIIFGQDVELYFLCPNFLVKKVVQTHFLNCFLFYAWLVLLSDLLFVRFQEGFKYPLSL